MSEAPLDLSNLQTLAAAVAEQAVIDLSDKARSVREDAAAFIWAQDFSDFLHMAGVGHTAAACRLSLRRRMVLPEPVKTAPLTIGFKVKLPSPGRTPPPAASEQAPAAATPAPSRERDQDPGTEEAGTDAPPPKDIYEALPEDPPPIAEPAPVVETMNGAAIIRI